MEVYTRYEWETDTLRNGELWLQTFGRLAKTQLSTYGVVMASMSVERTRLEPDNRTLFAAFREQLHADNNFLPSFKSPEDVVYAGWLKGKPGPGKSYSSVVVEFSTPDLANEAMARSLYWGKDVHHTERYHRNCKLRQCFNCWDYGHPIKRCDIDKLRCKKCAGPHTHKECRSQCNKCAACKGKHTATADSCPRRKSEHGKAE